MNTATTILNEMNSAQLRSFASEMKIKNYTQYKKAELLAILTKISQPKEEVINKSELLRGLLDELGMDTSSGMLMLQMDSRYGITMHRSHILTVRGKYLSA